MQGQNTALHYVCHAKDSVSDDARLAIVQLLLGCQPQANPNSQNKVRPHKSS
jgi:hypothetical protein